METKKFIEEALQNYVVYPSGKIYSKRQNKYLKTENVKGYNRVKLYYNGSSKKILVHRVVALIYIENIEGKPQVNHKDGNKTNNNYKNLEWVTNDENILHASINGLNNKRFNKSDILTIRKLFLNGTSQNEISRIYNASKGTINEIINRKIWNHV
jgi:hypothetical protein